MNRGILLVLVASLSVAIAQQVGTNKAEQHPSLSTSTCTKSGCTSQQNSIVLDANWRWLHTVGGYDNCYTGNTWNTQHCPDPVTCAKNCALDGADYQGVYGIETSGNSLTIGFVTQSQGKNIGSRMYLMENEETYYQFKLKNREFTIDVDVSNLPCGLNGALYFVEMPADGGLQYAGNKAGAKYGTGYCDAQCPHDLKFINGEANILDWTPEPNDPNSGNGRYGTCCTEMDIWEANSMAAAYTPHVCTVQGQYRCDGTQCGDGSNRYGGVCDKDGCDFNSYRMGNRTFLGEGKIVDTSKPFSVVTQFITNDGTDGGVLSEIRRIYVQNGKVIPNSMATVGGMKGGYTSVTDQFCNTQKSLFGDKNDFAAKGGLKSMSAALDRGMVLVLSLWDDHTANMLWLDSSYPANADPTKPGVARGACATDSGVPSEVESKYPNSNVKFSNIRSGQIGTTYNH